MATFLHTLRLVVGLAMLGAGAALTQPLAAAVFAGQRQDAAVPAAAFTTPAHGGGAGPRGGHAIADVRAWTTPSTPDGTHAGTEPGPASPRGAERESPAPLPARGPDGLPPTLDATYRSTVEIPPPPLLDVHSPPPLSVGRGTRDMLRPAVAPEPKGPAVTAGNTYVVRDGDDLTGIAMRVYGHAGAAEAIWNANRERLPDPRLLPIGITLRMPPSWMLPAARAGAGAGSIEPRVAGGGWAEAPPGGGNAVVPSEPQAPWLGAGAAPHGPALRPEGGAVPAGAERDGQGFQARNRPGTVRVGPGDSLDAIALRLYGDRAMAERIWAANRDRLRSPALLVPGTELRLP